MLTVDRTAFTDVRMVCQLVAGNPQSTVVLAMDRDVLASSVMLLIGAEFSGPRAAFVMVTTLHCLRQHLSLEGLIFKKLVITFEYNVVHWALGISSSIDHTLNAGFTEPVSTGSLHWFMEGGQTDGAEVLPVKIRAERSIIAPRAFSGSGHLRRTKLAINRLFIDRQ